METSRLVPVLVLRVSLHFWGLSSVESNASEGPTPSDRGRRLRQRLMSPWRMDAFEESGVLSDHPNR